MMHVYVVSDYLKRSSRLAFALPITGAFVVTHYSQQNLRQKERK